MLEEPQFHCLADAYLEAIADEIEAKDENSLIDIDMGADLLTLTLESGQQYVISKHLPSQQIWLASPNSGGLRFSYNEEDAAWELENGRKLSHILAEELFEATQVNFDFMT